MNWAILHLATKLNKIKPCKMNWAILHLATKLNQIKPCKMNWAILQINKIFTYFYFFLSLVPIGVAGGHSCLSVARWVAWRRDIP